MRSGSGSADAPFPTARSAALALAILTAGAALVAVAVAPLAVESVERYATFTGRTDVWRHYLAYLHERPLTGYGTGILSSDTELNRAIGAAVPGYEAQRLRSPHSLYIGLASESGLVGLAFFVAAHAWIAVVAPFRNLTPWSRIAGALAVAILLAGVTEMRDGFLPGTATLLLVAARAAALRDPPDGQPGAATPSRAYSTTCRPRCAATRPPHLCRLEPPAGEPGLGLTAEQWIDREPQGRAPAVFSAGRSRPCRSCLLQHHVVADPEAPPRDPRPGGARRRHLLEDHRVLRPGHRHAAGEEPREEHDVAAPGQPIGVVEQRPRHAVEAGEVDQHVARRMHERPPVARLRQHRPEAGHSRPELPSPRETPGAPRRRPPPRRSPLAAAAARPASPAPAIRRRRSARAARVPAASASANARLRAAEMPGRGSTKSRTSRPHARAAATAADTRGSAPSLSTTITVAASGAPAGSAASSRASPSGRR